MSKKVQKTLTGALAAVMATGVVATPALAASNTDVDALYKAAYQATQKALTEKTQASVNEARIAIKALPANLDWAIGEFSKQVDTIQHPILVNIVNAIKKAEAEPNQANINAAKKAIPAELAPIWKNSYSSAVDKIQQGLQAKTLEAVKKAEADKTKESIDAAKALLADLATADSQALKDWAKTLENRVEAVKSYDLNVTKVLEVSRYSVEVEFEALTEALEDVTIEVIDNKGNVVEVEAIDSLIEEEDTATFSFTNVLSAAPSGVWTINGVEVDLTERTFIDEVKAEDVAKDLLALLKDSKQFKNIVDENIDGYLIYIEDNADKINSYVDIQKAIDTVNKDVENENVVIDLVEVATEGSATQFKNALNKLDLEKVNSNWIDAYQAKIAAPDAVSENKLSVVQELIYVVNGEKITALKSELSSYDSDKKETKINELVNTIKSYHKDDEKDAVSTPKADLLAELNEELAIIKVQNATSLATLKAALVNLEKVVNNKTEFEYAKDVNESMLKAYFEGDVKEQNTVENIKNALASIQDEVIQDKIDKVDEVLVDPAKDEKYSAEEKTAITNALKALVTATSNKSGDEKFVMDKVVEANYEQYLTAKSTTTISTIEILNTIIENGNEAPLTSAIDAVKNAADADKLLVALKSSVLELKNVLDSNKEAYKAESDFASIDSVKAAQKLVDAVNAAQIVLASNDVNTVSGAILSFAVATDNAAVKNLSSVVRTDVAEEVKVLLKDAETLNIEELTDNLTTAISSQETNVTAVNDATDNVAMVAALLEVSSEFEKLDETQQLLVAEKFIAKFPTDKEGAKVEFTNYTEIRTLLAECMK